MERIRAEHKMTLPLYNGGLNESNIKFAKEQLLFDAFRKQTTLVKTKQHYPVNDTVEVNLELDMVVMSVEEYKKLLKNNPSENWTYSTEYETVEDIKTIFSSLEEAKEHALQRILLQGGNKLDWQQLVQYIKLNKHEFVQ